MKLIPDSRTTAITGVDASSEVFLAIHSDESATALALPSTSQACRLIVSVEVGGKNTASELTLRVYQKGSKAITGIAYTGVMQNYSTYAQTSREVFFVRSGIAATSLAISLESNNSADTALSATVTLYDAEKSLDIATVNDASPMSADDIADVILETPENLLATNPNGSIKGGGGSRF